MALPPPPKPRRRRTQSLAKMKDIVETFQPARSGKSELKGREKEHVKRTSEAGVPVEPPKPERKHGRTTVMGHFIGLAHPLLELFWFLGRSRERISVRCESFIDA
eukprot:1359411-Amorphochlora_amoeboformis.AAC.1